MMKRNTSKIKERLAGEKPVFAATFNFRIRHYDDDFHRLNDAIDDIAHASPGFLGKEYWSNEEEDKESVIYYWESLESLKKFSHHPDHQKAKRNYQKWYSGYEIIISQVLQLKSDDEL